MSFIWIPAEIGPPIEHIARTHGVHPLEVYQMVRHALMQEADPLPLEEQGEFHPYDQWGHGDIPGPYDMVDWFAARRAAMHNGKQHDERLKAADPSLSMLLWIYCDTIKWMRFWAVRAQHPEQRAKLSKALEEAELGLEALREKAFAKGNQEAVKGLSDV
jgi:hypothetical protein